MVFWDVTPPNLAQRNLPRHAMKAHRKNTGTAPLISNPGTRGSCEGNLMPQQLYPTKEPWYPLKRRVREHFGGKNNLLPLPGFKPQILQPTALSIY